jgi:hypothetical protein
MNGMTFVAVKHVYSINIGSEFRHHGLRNSEKTKDKRK